MSVALEVRTTMPLSAMAAGGGTGMMVGGPGASRLSEDLLHELLLLALVPPGGNDASATAASRNASAGIGSLLERLFASETNRGFTTGRARGEFTPNPLRRVNPVGPNGWHLRPSPNGPPPRRPVRGQRNVLNDFMHVSPWSSLPMLDAEAAAAAFEEESSRLRQEHAQSATVVSSEYVTEEWTEQRRVGHDRLAGASSPTWVPHGPMRTAMPAMPGGTPPWRADMNNAHHGNAAHWGHAQWGNAAWGSSVPYENPWSHAVPATQTAGDVRFGSVDAVSPAVGQASATHGVSAAPTPPARPPRPARGQNSWNASRANNSRQTSWRASPVAQAFGQNWDLGYANSFASDWSGNFGNRVFNVLSRGAPIMSPSTWRNY